MLSTTKWLTCMSALGKTGRKRLYYLFKNLLVWLFSSFMPTTFNLPLQMPKWANSVALYSRMRWKTVSIHFVPSNLKLGVYGTFWGWMPCHLDKKISTKKPWLSILEVWSIQFRRAGKWPVQSWIPILQEWHFQACWISSVTRWDCYLQRPSSWIDSCFMYLTQALYVSLPLRGHGFSLC